MEQIRRFFMYALIVILGVFFVLPPASAEAARKTKKSYTTAKKKGKAKTRTRRVSRKCDPITGKRQAMQLIESNERLASLANIQYKPEALSDELRRQLFEDGETLTEEDYLAEESMTELDRFLEEQEEGTLSTASFDDLWWQYVEKAEGYDWLTDAGISKRRLMEEILQWVGTRYHFGGTTRNGVDCSSFMQHIYEKAAAMRIPRTAREQYVTGNRIEEKEELRFGDMVFFNTRKGVYASHVGIYLGDNLFAHASSRYGVTVSSLESAYYNSRFIGGVRYDAANVVQMSVYDDLYAQGE